MLNLRLNLKAKRTKSDLFKGIQKVYLFKRH